VVLKLALLASLMAETSIENQMKNNKISSKTERTILLRASETTKTAKFSVSKSKGGYDREL